MLHGGGCLMHSAISPASWAPPQVVQALVCLPQISVWGLTLIFGIFWSRGKEKTASSHC